MQEKYARVGFKFANKNTRYAGIFRTELPGCCLPVSKEDFADVASFDSQFFPSQRSKFLDCWLFQKDASALIVRSIKTEEISGYGVIRKCVKGNRLDRCLHSMDRLQRSCL